VNDKIHLVFVLQWLFGFHEMFGEFVNSKIMKTVADGLYYIFPKTGEMSDIAENLALGQNVNSWMPLWSTLLFSIVLIIVTIFIFKRKDY